MSAVLDALLPVWGPWLVGLLAFLSALMIPLPASGLLIAAGALTGTGHLPLPLIWLGAVLGAVLGDLTAYALARRLGARIPGRPVLARARALIARYGALAVFLSRWLVSPLGPASNYVAGAAGLRAGRFALASAAGEMLWAGLTLGAGHLAGRGFRGHDRDLIYALAAAGVLALALWALRGLWHRRHGGTI